MRCKDVPTAFLADKLYEWKWYTRILLINSRTSTVLLLDIACATYLYMYTVWPTSLNSIPVEAIVTAWRAKYSKTSLTRTSGDRLKTSVLTKVRVIRKLKKFSQSYSTLTTHTENAMPIIVIIIIIIIIIMPWGSKAVTYISSLLFVSTDRKPPQLLPVFAPFNFIDNRNFLV